MTHCADIGRHPNVYICIYNRKCFHLPNTDNLLLPSERKIKYIESCMSLMSVMCNLYFNRKNGLTRVECALYVDTAFSVTLESELEDNIQ